MKQRIGLFTTGVLAAGLCSGRAAQAQQTPQTVRFGGLVWEVRQAGNGGPGPNAWNPRNVRVDRAGLHLKISRTVVNGKTEWQCAELSTQKSLGFGTYQFQVVGAIDRLDRNVVLGLFDYPTPDVGPDGTNEIDIEFARWGHADAPPGSYTVYPASGKRAPGDSHPFAFTLNGDYTTHRFVRSAASVRYTSLHGHRDDNANLFATWDYAPADKRLIPQKPLPVHINLWLFEGKPPTDGKEVEIIIKKFTYTPTPERKRGTPVSGGE